MGHPALNHPLPTPRGDSPQTRPARAQPVLAGRALGTTNAPGESADPLRHLLSTGALRAHLQPIVDLRSGDIHGHEALIRGPAASALAHPDALFKAAREGALELELELACFEQALQAWAREPLPTRLFVNLSAQGLTTLFGTEHLAATLRQLHEHRLPPTQLVLELTEQERVDDVEALRQSVRLAAEHGIQLALDDFGDGRSSLRLWSELKPALVKIDKYFTRGLAESPDKLQTLRALLQIAQTLGASLVAEGIERDEELRLLRDLGIEFGQGWLLGRPEAQAARQPLPTALAVIRSRQVSVMPEQRWAAPTAFRGMLKANWVEPLSDDVTNNHVLARFSADPTLLALPVVDEGQRVLGLIARHAFEAAYARLYFRELYGRRSCLLLAQTAPLCIDIDTPPEALLQILVSAPHRYLSQGFVLTRQGSYHGLGDGEALVKAVSEWRLQVARHANPLTQLPGNIPITLHLDQLLQGQGGFVAAHFDLDRFKPFNDRYGYSQGDDMIRATGEIILAACDPEVDFVGHVGGDDFIVLYQSEDWLARAQHILQQCNERLAALASTAAAALKECLVPGDTPTMATTLSVGAVVVPPQVSTDAQQVALHAASAKKLAKQSGAGLHVLTLAGQA